MIGDIDNSLLDLIPNKLNLILPIQLNTIILDLLNRVVHSSLNSTRESSITIRAVVLEHDLLTSVPVHRLRTVPCLLSPSLASTVQVCAAGFIGFKLVALAI